LNCPDPRRLFCDRMPVDVPQGAFTSQEVMGAAVPSPTPGIRKLTVEDRCGREKVALTHVLSINDHRRKPTKKDETIGKRTKDRGSLAARFTKPQ
jgi:hypothetical protein